MSNTLKLGLSLSFPVLYLNALGVLGVLFDYSVDWSIHYAVVAVLFVLFMAETLSKWGINTDSPGATSMSCLASLVYSMSNLVAASTLVAFFILSSVAGVIHVLGTPVDNPSLLSYALAAIVYIYFEGWRNFWVKLPFSVIGVLTVAILIEGGAGVIVYLNSATLLLLLFLSAISGFWLASKALKIKDLLEMRIG